MRYEGKHQYFKRWARIMGNFRNIPKTLAMHHQRNLCYELAGGASYLHSPTLTGPGKLKPVYIHMYALMYIVNILLHVLLLYNITAASKCNSGTLMYSQELKAMYPNITEDATLYK